MKLKLKKLKFNNTNLLFRLMCILLIVTSFTCIALAKYISSRASTSKAEIASLRCSISVNLDKSQTTVPFSNSQYMINGNVMNIPQKVPFLVNNCDLNADGTYSKPSGVDLKYDLIFYIPKEFATISALQLAKRDETTREYVAASPLYLLKDFLFAENEVKVIGNYEAYNKANQDAQKLDYGSLIYGNDETFKLQVNVSGDDVKEWKSDKTTIDIKEVNQDSTLSYVFPTYDKKPNLEVGKKDNVTMFAPLHVNKAVKNLGLYEIRISRTDFVLKGGERQDGDYHLRITPIGDLKSGNNTCQTTSCKDKNTTCQSDNYITCQDAIYGTPFSNFYKTLSDEDKKTLEWDGRLFTTDTINDTKYFNFKEISLENQNAELKRKELGTDGVTLVDKTLNIYVDTFIQKSYPVRINAIFTQTKI